MSESPSAKSTEQAGQPENNIPPWSSRLYRQVGFSAKKTWQDRGDIIRHSRELFTAAGPNGLSYSLLPTSSSIRLLEVKPGNPSDVLHCSLQTVDLSDNPKYHALSYTWVLDPPSFPYELRYLSQKVPNFSKVVTSGVDTVNHAVNRLMVRSRSEVSDQDAKPAENTTDRDKILCDGKGVYVKSNLYQALLQLRKARPGLYWIDAICINQSNLTELGQQVQMMNRIYSSASQVTIWLGTCPHVFSPGVANLVQMTKTGLPEITEAAESKDFYYKRVGTTSLWHLVLCVFFIVTRKWFKRLWVLQELCLAKEAIFLLGEYRFEADDISIAFGWMRSILSAWNTSGLHMFAQILTSFGDMPDQAISLLNSRRTISEGDKVGLQEWFRLVKDREARDPRDMVYGGLALIKPETLLMDPSLKQGSGNSSNDHDNIAPDNRQQWPSLHADYAISLPAVLEKVALCLLSGPEPMNLLSLATRYRTPFFYDMTRDTSIHYSAMKYDKMSELELDVPSWYAVPWLENSRGMKLLIWQNTSAPLASISKMTNKPLISADGESLFLDAAHLDTIDSCVFYNFFGDLAHDMESMITLSSKTNERAQEAAALKEIFNYAPPFHLLEVILDMTAYTKSTEKSPLEILCDLLTAGTWKGSASSKMVGFCQWLDDWVNNYLKEHEKEKAKITDETPILREFIAKREPIIAKIQDDYAKLRTAYPDQPWSPEDRKAISEERKIQASHFARTLQIAQTVRALFKTQSGKLILAPAWAEKGDVVMAVKGGKVPYVFTPKDEDIKRKIAFKEKYNGDISISALKERPGHKEAQKWDAASLQGDIERKDGYLLTGEAYLHDSDLKEILVRELEFGRLEIV
ncbi:heterokaryon incompatibility protein-domain-containing protein [Fusarium redolens]|uniref:Heterokaryon incompatibility protein-domain-containing protein n=1 Tax=Fusarium redolens TaxID=48865 RepID=A0A9P9JXK6_FUSRE|nr:heterokaryon incompatibility protein-domain-containing protein [Fusarium redolens]KAH7240718.1 heterokaryon incompatibility protein-domain-containing protein [Fusarium redolens]